MEMMPSGYGQTFFGTMWCILEALIKLVGSLLFWQVTQYTDYYIAVGVALQVNTCICLLFLPESPRWLVEKQRLSDAEKCFDQIARWNGYGDSFRFNRFGFRSHSVLLQQRNNGNPDSFISVQSDNQDQSKPRYTTMYYLR